MVSVASSRGCACDRRRGTLGELLIGVLGRVQIDERRPRSCVPEALHELRQAGAMLCREGGPRVA